MQLGPDPSLGPSREASMYRLPGGTKDWWELPPGAPCLGNVDDRREYCPVVSSPPASALRTHGRCGGNLLKDLPQSIRYETLRYSHANDNERPLLKTRCYMLSGGMGVAWW